jgi:uncharacterized protein YjiS (DUF1127 family)
MAMIDTAAELGRTVRFAPRLTALLGKGWSALQERRKRARLRATLYSLADRDLKDIGVAWSEIEHLALNGTDVRVDPRGHAAARASREVEQRGAL